MEGKVSNRGHAIADNQIGQVYTFMERVFVDFSNPISNNDTVHLIAKGEGFGL